MIKTVTGSENAYKSQSAASNPQFEQLKVKADAFKDKMSEIKDQEELEQIITEHHPEIDMIKVKANTFIAQVSKLIDNPVDVINIKANLKNENAPGPNKFSFNVKPKQETIPQPKVSAMSKDAAVTENNITETIGGSTTFIYQAAKGKLNDLSSKIGNNETLNTMVSEGRKIINKAVVLTPENKIVIEKIIDKVNSGKNLNPSDINNLKKLSTVMVMYADQLGISSDLALKLHNMVNKYSEKQEMIKVKKEAFIEKSGKLQEKLDKLNEIVNEPGSNIDPAVAKMIKLLQAKYDVVRASGDSVSIMIFNTYVDKIMNTLENVKNGKEKDPMVFQKIMAQYENFSEKLLNKMGEKKLLSEKEMNDFLGDAAPDVTTILTMELDQDMPPEIIAIDDRSDLLESETTPEPKIVAQSRKELLGFSKEEKKELSTVSLNSVRKAMDNQSFSSKIFEIRQGFKDSRAALAELTVAKKENVNVAKEFRTALRDTAFAHNIMAAFAENNRMQAILGAEVEKLIASADRMTEELDLEVNPDGASIVELLQSFRKIIVQLDLDLRKLNQANRETELIDEKFTKSIEENKYRQKFLDKSRTEFINSMEENKERILNT